MGGNAWIGRVKGFGSRDHFREEVDDDLRVCAPV